MATLDSLVTLVLLALAVGTVSMTIAEAKIFDKARREVRIRNLWFYNLVSCSYCVSYWLAFVAVVIYQPRVVVSSLYVLDLLVSAFAVVALAVLVQVPIAVLFDRKAAQAQKVFARRGVEEKAA